MTSSTLFTRQQSDSGNTTTCATNNGINPSSIKPALYTEPYRPQIHFSPSTGFMNDPNGLVKSGDTWHMYFQYNPNATVAGFQHWGHATSKDLYHWQNHLYAIAPDSDDQGIFSGSAVLDVNNTSGFFNDSVPADSRFVAIYTLNTPTAQNQNIAYSTDGQNYTKYSGNPVISLNTTQFRDPKVFWDEQKSRWVMAVSHSQDYQIGFYASTNLREWNEVSRFGPSGILGYQYECPDLLQIPISGGDKDGQKAWVLVLSINPGAPLGGSFIQAFIGDWDGTNFKPWDGSTQIVDFGKDFYAAQTFYNAPNDQAILIGWVGNWQYANAVPTSPWRSSMTVPRQMTVRYIDMNPMHKGYQVTMEPYGLESLQKQQTNENTTSSNGNQTVSLDGNGAFEILANLSYPSTNYSVNPRAEFLIHTPNQGEYLKVGILYGDPTTVYVDRRLAGKEWSDSNPFFTDRFSQQFHPITTDNSTKQIVRVHMIVDRMQSELFVQDGVASASILHFWDNEAKPSSLSVGLGDDQIKLDSLQVNAINSTWPTCP
ncbi:putative SUC2-invertase [Meira miltonrushii]|uniref:Putative SUC2-invertase n=1 Tax=Meira miltonrushii TaxID=1280837 RepID=A0A316V7Q9_9BASI|nr:putative SUC2-invertase [Meira miltonrushii]PWN33659.1 putative SUC2-invertase [Meira miltonrushii]